MSKGDQLTMSGLRPRLNICKRVMKRPADRPHLVERATAARAIGEQHEVSIPAGIDTSCCSPIARAAVARSTRCGRSAGRFMTRLQMFNRGRNPLMVSWSPFDIAQGDPQALEGSNHELSSSPVL